MDTTSESSSEYIDKYGSEEHETLAASLQLFDAEQLITSDEQLRARIEEEVVRLLTEQPERLMHVLYRIDVSEQAVDAVMKNTPIGGIAARLTILLIERMRQKVQTRRQYRNSRNISDS